LINFGCISTKECRDAVKIDHYQRPRLNKSAVSATAGWARPKIARDHSRALTREQIAALWRLDVRLREKTLWRLLYETAARASEILTLDIADLDRPGKRARVISKGGDIDWVYYQTGTALLLPRLLAGRTRGPVFLAERAPTRATPTLCRRCVKTDPLVPSEC